MVDQTNYDRLLSSMLRTKRCLKRTSSLKAKVIAVLSSDASKDYEVDLKSDVQADIMAVALLSKSIERIREPIPEGKIDQNQVESISDEEDFVLDTYEEHVLRIACGMSAVIGYNNAKS